MTTQKRKLITIQLTVLSVFLVVTVIIAGLILGLQYYFSTRIAKSAAEKNFDAIAQKVSDRIIWLDRNNSDLATLLSTRQHLDVSPVPGKQNPHLSAFSTIMNHSSNFYAVYIGHTNGDFYEVINLESGNSVRRLLEAAPSDRWVVVKIRTVNGNRIKTYEYLNPDYTIRFSKLEPTTYDPRQRPWFKAAQTADGVIKTAPYLFSQMKVPGVTYAHRTPAGHVIGMDISLASMSDFLKKQLFSRSSEIFLLDENGNVTAYAQSNQESGSQRYNEVMADLTPEEKTFIHSHPVIRVSNEMDWPPFDFALSGSPRGYSIDILDLIARKTGLKFEYINGLSWNELVGLFKRGDMDLMHSLVKTAEREQFGLFTDAYIPMPQVFVCRTDKDNIKTLESLYGKTVALPKGWATAQYLAKHHPQIRIRYTRTTLEAMQEVSKGMAVATMESEPVVRYLLNTYFPEDLAITGNVPELWQHNSQALHFMVQPHMTELRGILNTAIAHITEKERLVLEDQWFLNRMKKPSITQTSLMGDSVPYNALLNLIKSRNDHGKIKKFNANGKKYFGYVESINSVHNTKQFLALLVERNDILKPYLDTIRLSLMVAFGALLACIPLVWVTASIIVKPIRALVIESKKVKQRRFDEVAPVKSRIKEIVNLSNSMTSMAAAIQKHQKAQQHLMDSFIKLMASTIDEKSPYTGKHCERVPQLAMMLAKAASDSHQQPFSHFKLHTPDQWREFEIAAWLHDCGKIITPEHIVDKSTKLETIYNRIHEIRTRFEVLLRDARIRYWKESSQNPEKTVELQQALKKTEQQLQEDFAFIAGCNVGGEFMAEEDIERVKKIAGREWIRHFDNRLGLSHIELGRYKGSAEILPCKERLLADLPEHLFPRPSQGSDKNNVSGLNIEIPEYFQNQGEVYNLCVPKGTLSKEERYRIQEHSISTIRMLELLPFPRELEKIPEIAGAHHETLAGTGYPRKLTEDQLSIPARILAIADIFEALTASDRPYKTAKSLNEALKILNFMKKERHIDKALFELFLSSGVYLAYAREFLSPEQLDEVEITQYLD